MKENKNKIVANPWFKFYGIEFLADPKIRTLSSAKRSCLITLFCYAAQGDGIIKNVTEQQLMIDSGVDFQNDEWDRTKGVLKTLKKLKIITLRNGEITLVNWKKRQENQALTNAERQARYRGRNDDVTESNGKVTLDKKKIRKEEEN